jgi:hypothetical protein
LNTSNIQKRQAKFDDDDSNNNNLSNILRKYEIKDLQKAAMLDPVQALGVGTNVKVKNIQHGK